MSKPRKSSISSTTKSSAKAAAKPAGGKKTKSAAKPAGMSKKAVKAKSAMAKKSAAQKPVQKPVQKTVKKAAPKTAKAAGEKPSGKPAADHHKLVAELAGLDEQIGAAFDLTERVRLKGQRADVQRRLDTLDPGYTGPQVVPAHRRSDAA